MRILQAGLSLTIAANHTFPDLRVLYTNSESEVASFLRGWEDQRHVGLAAKVGHGSFGQSWTVLLQLSAGREVLMYDRVPLPPHAEEPGQLPECLRAFLVDERRTFYGSPLAGDAWRLAHELRAPVRGVDFRVRAWPRAGLARLTLRVLARRLLGVPYAWWHRVREYEWGVRPLSRQALETSARLVYLRSALARAIQLRYGRTRNTWLLTQAELRGAGEFWLEARAPMRGVGVLLTSDEAEAAKFLAGWAGVYHFGLDLLWSRSAKGGAARRAAVLQLSAMSRVLMFDLVPLLGDAPRSLPESLRFFLQDDRKVFFGFGVVEKLAHLAFEFGCMVRLVDFRCRSWPELAWHFAHKRVTVHSAIRLLKANITSGELTAAAGIDWESRPVPAKAMGASVQLAYLPWIFAHYGLANFGAPSIHSCLVEAELLAPLEAGLGFPNQEAASDYYMHRTLTEHAGIPQLDVLYTGDEAAAALFLLGWSSEYHVGLDTQRRHVGLGSQVAYNRTALLQLSAAGRVLIFDVVPLVGKPPRELPQCLRAFLEDDRRTFYGWRLLDDLARLSFEFGVAVRGVDISMQAWPELKVQLHHSDGLVGLAANLLGTELRHSRSIKRSMWESRPLTLWQLAYMTECAYLCFAVGEYFRAIGRTGELVPELFIQFAAEQLRSQASRRQHEDVVL